MLRSKGFRNLKLEGREKVRELLSRFGDHIGAFETRHVSLRFCAALEMSDLKLLENFKNLESVNLDYCQKIKNDGIRILVENWSYPLRLSLFWMPWIDGKGIEHLKTIKTLRHLNISGLTHLEDKEIARLIQSSGRQLTYLDLTRIKNVGTHTLRAVGQQCTRLQTLRLYACEQFSDEGLRLMAKGCRDLRHLDLCGAKGLSDKGIKAVAMYCRSLDTLNLTWCINLTDESLIALANCPLLCHLSIHGNKHMSDRGIQALRRGCGRIKTLDINGCCSLSLRTLESLRQLFPELNELVPL